MIEIIFFLLLPLILILIVVITYVMWKGMYIRIGFSGREVGLLVLGPFAAMLFDLPIFIYKNYFLAINIGGALIPLILSLYLIKKLHLSLAKTIVGITLVSLATFFVTKVTDIGVVSSFPFYLLPSILSFLLSLLLFSPHSEKTPGYGYAIATIGVLVGGDIFHLPEIFEKPFTGSVGGAGLYDMVYIAGLLSFCILLFFIGKEIKSFPYLEKGLRKHDLYAMDEKQSFYILIKEVEKKTGELGRQYGLHAPPFLVLKSLIGERAAKDYIIMKRKAKGNPSRIDVEKAWITTNVIISALEEREKKLYASVVERCTAFLFDFLIIGGIAFLCSILFYLKMIPSFLIFFFSIQFIYFTIFEYITGSTVGKMVIGIRVAEVDMGKVEFMTSFTRNVIRFLDMAIGFYFLSIILIKFSPKGQRLGDIIAGSIVVKNM